MRRISFVGAFLFKYSPRPGARSAEWPDSVPDEEKKRRITILIGEQKQRSLESNAAAVGTEVEVLVEGPAKRNPDQWFGKTVHFKTAVFPHRGERIGDTIAMRVAAASPYTLFGEGVPVAAHTVEDVTA
jgi:tRNA-2-methylthio-N6-dimethylallyladenosine synthase